VAPFLPPSSIESDVFRAIILSVVFALATAQNAVVLCKVFCEPQVASHAACHDKQSTHGPRIIGDDGCDNVAPVSTAFLKEDVRRPAPDSRGDLAIATPRCCIQDVAIEGRPPREPGHLPALERRPLVTALRI